VTAGKAEAAPWTSKRELELIALHLFTEQGFGETTVEQIAAAAGSAGGLLPLLPDQGQVLWYQFDDEVAALRAHSPGARR